jgi:hypothetical protein
MSRPRLITYYLPAKHITSSRYYNTIELFATQAIQRVFETAKPLVMEFQEFSSGKQRAGKIRICLDLLTLGVYLKEHVIFNWDLELTKKDLLRSFELLKEWFIKVKYDPLISIVDSWKEFFAIPLKQNPKINFPNLLKLIVNDFQMNAAKVLDEFTPNIEQFLNQGNHEDREDTEMRKHSRLEYHMNMVAAEILEKEFRASFLMTKRKIVLAPPCSKTQPDDKCEAISTSFGLLCQKCTPTCRVHDLTKLGEEKDFETYIVGELGDIPENLKNKGIKLKDVGVLGIACIATLAPGGRKAEYLGLPAQGILLDYCGCTEHWNDNPENLIITNFNKRKLLQVLGIH